MDYLNNSLISTLGLEKEGILARFALSFQIILCSECFVTILAAEWYLSGVDFFISLQITCCLERFDTLGEVECFSTCMKSLMSLQTIA